MFKKKKKKALSTRSTYFFKVYKKYGNITF